MARVSRRAASVRHEPFLRVRGGGGAADQGEEPGARRTNHDADGRPLPRPSKCCRTAYAMGVENGVHLCDDLFNGIDELATARVIAAAVKDGGYDIILAGKHAIDYDSGQVGPAPG